MADITSLYQGEAADEGQQNWRGDQVSVPQGGQSIYKTSSVKLAELGSRKVVGDRVFRYARAKETINAGEICQATAFAATQVNQTMGVALVVGTKTIPIYSTGAIASGVFDDGYVFMQSGTHPGITYKIKTQAAIATTSTGLLTLYDTVVTTATNLNKITMIQNPYKDVLQDIAGTAPAIGVAPIGVTTGDYFWLQTWGPCGVKCGAGSPGLKLQAGATGECTAAIATTGAMIGWAFHTFTASERGLVWLTIAP